MEDFMFKGNFKRPVILFILLSLSGAIYADDSATFQKALKENNMIFSMPEGFSPVPVIENEDVSYLYAIKNNNVKLEVRYCIFSLKARIKEYQDFKKKKKGEMADPNTAFDMFTSVLVMNIAGSEQYNSMPFDEANVKAEFNADKGGSYTVECQSGFGEGYKSAMIVALHKDNVSDAYMVFLFDDVNDVMTDIMGAFYSMKFK
jgi:hypothetical protein